VVAWFVWRNASHLATH